MLINKQRIKNIVNQYYEELYDLKGSTVIKVYEEDVGYGMNETKDCEVKIIYKAKIKILFEDTIKDEEIDEEKLKEIFSYFLGKENYTLKSLNLDKGIDSKLEGYGLGEHLVNYPYFRGVNIEINEKVKKIGEK